MVASDDLKNILPVE